MPDIFKQISMGDVLPFAKGGTGECYRLDEDTILKLYYEGFPEERIVTEKEGARAALIAGVPTAISFQLVQAGNRKGIIFEMIRGKTLAEMIREDPSRAADMGRTFAGIALTLHRAEVRKANLPPVTQEIRDAVGMMPYAPEGMKERVLRFLDELDRYRRYVHGDFHPNNVIMTENGPMLIDMGGFSVGCPLFDLATTYFSLFESPEAKQGGRSSFNGLTQEEARAFWQGFWEEYCGGPEDEEEKHLLEKIVLLKKLRFEVLYGKWFSEEYCRAIRDEVLDAFGKEREEENAGSR